MFNCVLFQAVRIPPDPGYYYIRYSLVRLRSSVTNEYYITVMVTTFYSPVDPAQPVYGQCDGMVVSLHQ